VTRAEPWSMMPSTEWARPLGASPPKRMIASWPGPYGSTECKVAARAFAPAGGLPSDQPRSARSSHPPPGRNKAPPSSPPAARVAPCSTPSRPLRAAFGGGLRPALTASARGARQAPGRDEGMVRPAEQRDDHKAMTNCRSDRSCAPHPFKPLDNRIPMQGSAWVAFFVASPNKTTSS
jgi:hypothetical protein